MAIAGRSRFFFSPAGQYKKAHYGKKPAATSDVKNKSDRRVTPLKATGDNILSRCRFLD